MTDEKQVKPEGYYVAEIPTEFGKVIAKDGKEVNLFELIVEMANKIERAGLK